MNPLDAEPDFNQPVPPPYELASKEEYEVKLSDAFQRSLQISQSSSSSRTPSWETSDSHAFESAQTAMLGRSRGAGHGSDAGDIGMGRRTSNETHSSVSSKDRSLWYAEAGRRSAPVADPRLSGSRPLLSRASNQTTSPIGRRTRAYDEEAGIDNPPPPFGAPRSDWQGAYTTTLDSPPPVNGASGYGRHSRSSSASQNALPSPASSSSSSRNGIHLDAPLPRGSPTPTPSLNSNSRHSMPPPPIQPRQGRDSHSSHARAGSVATATPHLVFDPAVAYQNNYTYTGSTGGAVNASAFYNNAVSTILNAAAATPQSITFESTPQSTNLAASSATRRELLPQSQLQQPPLQPQSQYPTQPSRPHVAVPSSRQTLSPTESRPASAQDTPRAERSSRRASSQSYFNTPMITSPQNLTPKQTLEYYNPSASSEPPWLAASSSGRGPASNIMMSSARSESGYSNSSRPPSRQSSTEHSVVSSAALSVVSAPPHFPARKPKPKPPQVYQPQPTVVCTPGSGAREPWVPPGAARPQNLYGRRF